MKETRAKDADGKESVKVRLNFTLGNLGVGRGVDFRFTKIFGGVERRSAWCIYHIPSGAAFPTEFETLKEAIVACRYANKLGVWAFPPAKGLPEKWFKKYPKRILA